MRRSFWIGLAVLAGVVLVAGRVAAARGEAQGRSFECNEATLRGTYGAQMTGSRPFAGGGTEPIIGLALRTYDGAGNFTQIDNLRGAFTGVVPDRPGFGTYQVNANCTAVAQLQPAPGILIEERMVIVADGAETRSITASPLQIFVSAVAKRIDRR